MKVPATLAHGVAIFTTTFRLLYRWYLARISWEDGWATLALMCGVACLASVWIKAAPQTRQSPLEYDICITEKTVSFSTFKIPDKYQFELALVANYHCHRLVRTARRKSGANFRYL